MEASFNTYWQPPDTNSQLEHISNALSATLDPRVPNDIRQQALQHLEAVKSQPDAPQHGFSLADDWKQNDAVRYYGLQLLEFAVRYRWNDYTDEQALQVRTWIKQLAGSLREQDAIFLRNKVGQLWVEVAKRCWGGAEGEWNDMDTLLVNLWQQEKGAISKILVLGILEGLNEDIMHGEDAVAGLRLDVLGNCLNEVTVPAPMYKAHKLNKQVLRGGEEGWLSRICGFFALCVKEARLQSHDAQAVKNLEACAVKALLALRPVMSWISLKGAEQVNCVDCLYLPFMTSNIALQTAAVEVLYSLLGRAYNPHSNDIWTLLMRQAMQPERIAIIRQAFEQSVTGPGEDEERYTLQKKMSELLSVFADSIAQHNAVVDSTIDLPALFDLLIKVTEHKSLTVSIPVLHSWTKLLGVQDGKIIDLVLAALPTLLNISSERLVRYESLPEDTEDHSLNWLAEDFDTVPERHAFLGNYRRYCTTIIQSIARSRPIDALSIVLNRMRELLASGKYVAGRGFDPLTYNKSSWPVLSFDAQYCTVMAALKGYSYWMGDVAEYAPEHELYTKIQRDQQQASESLQQWCQGMTNIHVDDPGVADEVLQTLVAILRTLKSPPQSFVLAMVQHLLTMRLYDQPEHQMFSDAVKSFEALRVVELQKLALAFPNVLLEVYSELEPRIEVLAQKHNDDQRLVWGYKAFLFMIVHRATGIDEQARMARLQSMLKPTYDAWTNSTFATSVESFQSFCDSVGLSNLPDFYKQHGFDRVQDWSSRQLDEAGQARQTEIKDKADHLPLRMTKSMLSATTERLKGDSMEYENACTLWGGLIPSILPSLLQMIRHAQAFHNMGNWSQLPDELQAVVKRTLQDRFWQSGISNESKDEFYARISGSKTSYEGFASTVRGTMRNTREMGYHIIYLMTKFEEQFYGIDDLAEPLADAIFSDATSLGANHLHLVINLTTGLVQRCPPQYRSRFLPPILRRLFVTLDAKISAEWESIGQAAEQNKQEMDELSDEMRTESVLRQLTYSMVSFVPFLLEYDRNAPPQPATNGHVNGNGIARSNLSDLVLSDPSVLEPLIMFCTHALRMRDSRCCSTICRVFRTLIPVFAHTEVNPQPVISPAPAQRENPITPQAAAQVREFISAEVLKSCITSLNEPYFADLQKDLAALIAQILLLYDASKTHTPRNVLLSLPDMTDAKVDKAVARMGKLQSERQQRAIVLDLLEGVRGVSIYEMGKVQMAKDKKKKDLEKGVRSEYTMEVDNGQRPAMGREENGQQGGLDDDGIEGVAGLFGGA